MKRRSARLELPPLMADPSCTVAHTLHSATQAPAMFHSDLLYTRDKEESSSNSNKDCGEESQGRAVARVALKKTNFDLKFVPAEGILFKDCLITRTW